VTRKLLGDLELGELGGEKPLWKWDVVAPGADGLMVANRSMASRSRPSVALLIETSNRFQQ
jgi:hypothetical protein